MSTTLSDHAWERIHAILTTHPDVRLTAGTRLFLTAWLWMLRTGAQWRELPERFGKWNSVYKRVARWSKLGVFAHVLEVLSRDADYEWLMVDSTTCRAHMSAAGAPASAGGQQAQSLGRSRGGFSPKIHIKTDALGLPLEVTLTPGNRGDMIGVWDVLEPEDACASYFLADTAYDANKLRDFLEQIEVEAVIPSNPSRSLKHPCDRELYKARHAVECFVNKIKWFRRIATRYDKLDATYLGFLKFACCLIWLR